MTRNRKEEKTVQLEGGYTRIYYCPANGNQDVDIKFSGTTKPLGGDPVEETKEIPCRYNISDPSHMDLTAIVAIPISAVAAGLNQARAVALKRAQEIFTPPQPSPQ